jgi:hypothetical protein
MSGFRLIPAGLSSVLGEGRISANNGLMHRSKGPSLDHLVRTGRQCRSLFEYGVGTQQKRIRNREANGLRSLEIDDQLELCGLLNR